jgi:hypothetical protein
MEGRTMNAETISMADLNTAIKTVLAYAQQQSAAGNDAEAAQLATAAQLMIDERAAQDEEAAAE